MIALLLAVLTLQEPTVADLLRQLEDDRVEVREKAQKELGARGEPARAALKGALAAPGASAELKLRGAAALREIELAIRTTSKTITLKGRDTMIAEILDEIARQSGASIDRSAIDGASPVTLDLNGTPLLQALDQLCAGREDRSWELHGGGIRFLKEAAAATPTQYAGPFRIRATRVELRRASDFKSVTADLRLNLSADAEPQLTFLQPVQIEITRALDERGRPFELKAEDDDRFDVLQNGPNLRIRVVGVMQTDSLPAVLSLRSQGLSTDATTVKLWGSATYRLPLEPHSVVFKNLDSGASLDLGDCVVTLEAQARILSFAPKGEAQESWQALLAQRLDKGSLIGVTGSGQEIPGRLTLMAASLRIGGPPALPKYQVEFPAETAPSIKELRFRYMDQVAVKVVPFALEIKLP